MLDAVGGHDRLEIAPAQTLHDVRRPSGHGIPIAAERLEIDARAEIVHLGVAHARADVTARDAETSEPAVVEHLRAIHDEAVHPDVLDPRHVPEQPGHGIDAGLRPAAHLALRQPPDGGIGQHTVHLLVADQEEVDRVHALGSV